jgi:hypothetical protein
MRPGWVLQGENIAILFESRFGPWWKCYANIKVLRHCAGGFRTVATHASGMAPIWCDMHWYATYTHTITYNIQLPQDPQGPGTLRNMRNMRSMRSICSARQISKLLPVSFMSFMSLHCRHLPKGGKEVSESRRMFGTTVAKYGYSWLLIIHKYI